MDKLRIDKWLWAARFYKTRSLATEAVQRGRVHIGVLPCKPAREVRPGDRLTITQAHQTITVDILALSDQRGPAPVAQQLYRETEDSIARRHQEADARRWHAEPAHSLTQGRPTKRDRRDLDGLQHPEPMEAPWDSRWSARWEPPGD